MKTLSELINQKAKDQGLNPRECARMEHWIRRFHSHFDEQPLHSMGTAQVREFLRTLNKDPTLSASDRMSACNALTFLYNDIVPELDGAPKASPVAFSGALSWKAAWDLVRWLDAPWNLAATLVLGLGARLEEVLELRLSDIDLRSGKMTLGLGPRRRTLTLAPPLLKMLHQQMANVMKLFREDQRLKRIFVVVDRDGRREYVQESKHYPLFPSLNPALDLASGKHVRGVVDGREFEKKLRQGAIHLGITSHVSAAALRQAFVLRRLDKGTPIANLARHLGCSPEEIRLFRNLGPAAGPSSAVKHQETTAYRSMETTAAKNA